MSSRETTLPSIFLALASVLLAFPAEGDPTVWRFEGVGIEGIGIGPVQPEAFVGFVSFDSLSRVDSPDERGSTYFGEGPAYGIEVRVDSEVFGAHEDQLTIRLVNDFASSEMGRPRDVIEILNHDPFSFPPPLGDRISIGLTDCPATVLESTELPIEAPEVDSFCLTTFWVQRDLVAFGGHITDIELVPEPRASIGLIIALGALSSISRGYGRKSARHADSSSSSAFGST